MNHQDDESLLKFPWEYKPPLMVARYLMRQGFKRHEVCRTPLYLFNELTREYTRLDYFVESIPKLDEVIVHILTTHPKNEDVGVFVVCTHKPFRSDTWCKKAINITQKHPHIILILLMPAHTHTDWWHEYVLANSKDIRFIKGKMVHEPHKGKFVHQTNPAVSLVVFANPNLPKQSLDRFKNTIGKEIEEPIVRITSCLTSDQTLVNYISLIDKVKRQNKDMVHRTLRQMVEDEEEET